MLRLLITLLFVAAASRGDTLKDEKLKFYVTSSRSVEDAPTIGVRFANGVKDELVLSHYKMNDDAVIGCNYLGHLLRSPSSSVAVTGCLNKPGDTMEVTMISKNNINKMFSVDFYGDAEIIKNPFEEGATSGAVAINRVFDDEEEEDEILDPDEEYAASHVAQLASIPSKLKAVIKFGYEDTMASTLNGQDFNEWIAGVFTHTQAHFRHAASLGTTIEFEVHGSAVYNEGNSWTADDNIYDARRATNALNLDDVDVMSWWCDRGGGGVAGIAFVGAICMSYNTNLNERQWRSAGSGFVLAHELGHNFGMSHDFSDKHGGHSGPCNGQGIMSYGSYDYDQWSTCSKSDWEEHYTSENWGNGCLEDISGEGGDNGDTTDCSSFYLNNTSVGRGRGNGIPNGRINNVESVEDCRAECAAVPDCKFFIWNSPEARRKKLSCWLKKNDNNARSTDKDVGRISGPVTCEEEEPTCTDTSNGAVDNWGDGCDDYAQNLHWCGNYNNDALQSEVMCCACGGGSWA